MKKEMSIQIGDFEAERFWAGDTLRLPYVNSIQTQRIVLAMDELLFAFCRDGDLLYTRYPIDASFIDYLNDSGWTFIHDSCAHCESVLLNDYNTSIFEIFRLQNNIIENIKAEVSMSPYNINSHYNRSSISLRADVTTDADIVRKVNSKEYSTIFSQNHVAGYQGEIVYSLAMLERSYQRIKHISNKAIIKEPYGVSGKGSIILDSETKFKRITEQLRKTQEKTNKYVLFVIEPFHNNKSFDFSSHYYIDKNGHYSLLCVQVMNNIELKFSSIRNADASILRSLDSSNYQTVINKLMQEMFKFGYFGYVCIDSMMLSDSTIIPIIEINARKSFGYLNYAIRKRIAPNANSELSYFNLSLRKHIDFSEIYNCLSKRKILVTKLHPCGILPMSVNTLNANISYISNSDNVAFGRFYYCVIYRNDIEYIKYNNELRKAIESLNMRIL